MSNSVILLLLLIILRISVGNNFENSDLKHFRSGSVLYEVLSR